MQNLHILLLTIKFFSEEISTEIEIPQMKLKQGRSRIQDIRTEIKTPEIGAKEQNLIHEK